MKATLVRTPSRTMLALGLVGAILSACGGDAPGAGTDEANSPEAASAPSDTDSASESSEAHCPIDGPVEQAELTIGTIPVAATVWPLLADQLGYFEDEGLTIRQEILGGGPEVMPALQGGQFDIGFSAVASALLGREAGVNFRGIYPSSTIASSPPDTLPVLVRPNSGIDAPEKLVGATVGVNGLGGFAHVVFEEYIEREGVDSSSIQFIEVPFPGMLDVLEQGSADAVLAVEPVAAAAKVTERAEVAFHYVSEVLPGGVNISMWHAMGDWVGEHPATALRFGRAMMRAVDAAAEDHTLLINGVMEWTGLSQAIAEAIVYDEQLGYMNMHTLDSAVEIMQERELLSDDVHSLDYVWECVATSSAGVRR